MSWVCPNCSTSNGEEAESCFVCGMDRPARKEPAAPAAGEGKIFFSDSEAFGESLRKLFRRRTDKPAKPPKPPKPPKPAKTPKPAKPAKTSGGEADRPGPEIRRGGPDFAEPWPEHHIVFDTDMIRAKGFVRSERGNLNGLNGYNFYTEDGTCRFIRAEMVLMQKMAHKI